MLTIWILTKENHDLFNRFYKIKYNEKTFVLHVVGSLVLRLYTTTTCSRQKRRLSIHIRHKCSAYSRRGICLPDAPRSNGERRRQMLEVQNGFEIGQFE